jgi:BASS family bile acid:Na+ symporter
MGVRIERVAAAGAFLHRHFLWFLLGAYALAALGPGAGQRISGITGGGRVLGHEIRLSAPAAMLGFLLFAAGLAVKGEELRRVLRRPGALFVGLAASVVVPVLVLLGVSPLLALWHDTAEARDLVVGLAVVAAMPVAGSSSGWSRAADGDCALSLGLVLLSTLASPVTTPLTLRAAGEVAPVAGASDLVRLAEAGGAGVFVALWVVLPVLLGVLCRWVVGRVNVEEAGPLLKLSASVVLLVLCYANASSCLPGVVAAPDWDFLALVSVAAGVACGAAFAAGFGAARVVGADPARRASLVFGVGMANNGAGLALAAGALAGCPMALLPMIAVNLLQHLAAGWANARLGRGRRGSLCG